MSKSRQVIEQELQRDEVAEYVHGLVEGIKRNYKRAIIGLIVLVAIAIVISIVINNRQSGREQATAWFSDAVRNYYMMAGETDAKKRQDSLKSVLTTADNLIQAEPGSKLAREALFLQGNANYEMDKFEDARKAFQGYLDKAQDNEERAKGEIALAYTFENESFLQADKQKSRNLLDQALNNYERALRSASGGNDQNPAVPYLYYYALMGQARILELTGQDAKAIAIYERVLKDRPATAAAPKQDEKASERDPMMNMLRQQIEEQESQMSFQATAKLRLEQLKANPFTPATETKTTTVAPAAPAVSAAPAAAPAAAEKAPAAPAAPAAK